MSSMTEEEHETTDLPQIRLTITLTDAPDGDHFGFKAMVRNRERVLAPIEVLGLLRLAEAQYLDDLTEGITR